MKTIVCYGVLCGNKNGGNLYRRYFTALAEEKLTLENIREYAYPSALAIVRCPSRRQAKIKIRRMEGRDDMSQPDLFDGIAPKKLPAG